MPPTCRIQLGEAPTPLASHSFGGTYTGTAALLLPAHAALALGTLAIVESRKTMGGVHNVLAAVHICRVAEQNLELRRSALKA
jgi:hypothetical protein